MRILCIEQSQKYIYERNFFMKHYCNRKAPKQYQRIPTQTGNSSNTNMQQSNQIQESNMSAQNFDEVIFPPGYDYDIYADATSYDTEQDYSGAQGGSINQGSGYNREFIDSQTMPQLPEIVNNPNIFYDNMSGKFGVLSVPASPIKKNSMSNYLDKYLGKYICLDLWTSDSPREEMCGVLTEIGRDFLVINSPENDNLTMIDLRSIRYISIFCR